MSKRNFADWLQGYCSLVKHTEAPLLNHFWGGVGAIAGALRRHVWIDHGTFKWYPSFYIIFVCPPEVISKSTNAGVAMEILEAVPGIHFGPDNITWQSLVTSFANTSEEFQYGEEFIPMSAQMFFSSELGLLVDFNDRQMINILIDFWDGRKSFKKETKMSGNDIVIAPFISILACTTPDWIAANLPAIAVGGGFTSRCVFVYADKKERLVAHPKHHMPADFKDKQMLLLQDLEHIATNLIGEFHFSKEAIEWEETWYQKLWTSDRAHATPDDLKALQRRHTHINKLAMIVSVARSDSLLIEQTDFELADLMLRQTAEQYPMVFSRIGQSDVAQQATRFLEIIKAKGEIPYDQAYAVVHTHFPDARDYEGILMGLVRSGQVVIVMGAEGLVLRPKS